MEMTELNKKASPRYKMNMSVERYDELYLQDLSIFTSRLPHQMKSIRRRILKAPKMPMKLVLKENHGAEEIRIYSLVDNKKEPFHEGVDCGTVVFFKNSRGICAYINLDPYKVMDKSKCSLIETDKTLSNRFLFTPHFFERYEERYGWDKGFMDIHNQFFFNNMDKHMVVSGMEARPGDYKKVDVWSVCNDGLMLGEIRGEKDFFEGRDYIVQFNTFLDFDTLTKRQEEYSSLIMSIREYFRNVPVIESKESLARRTFVSRLL